MKMWSKNYLKDVFFVNSAIGTKQWKKEKRMKENLSYTQGNETLVAPAASFYYPKRLSLLTLNRVEIV
tara:strand:+ start:3490 stop:3693 length:204 start_codon:yes stop_codon:yes gene_type:complete